jgi:UDP-glucose 4-epimerase
MHSTSEHALDIRAVIRSVEDRHRAARSIHVQTPTNSADGVRDERILITGGGGAIGSNLVDQLVQAGAGEIVVLDNFVRGRRDNLAWALANGPVQLVEGDICDRDLVHDLVRGKGLVFHLAALRITQCAEEPRLANDVLVNGTFNVVEAAVEHDVRKLIASSSASVYGLATEFPTTEDHHPYANDTLYGAAKVYNEGLLRSYHAMTGLDYVALRYFNVYGERMDIHGVYTEVLVRWMERITAGQPPIIMGDGEQTMDFVFIADIARANVLAAQAPISDEIINIACGVETSLNELAQMLLRVMGSDLSIEYGPERKVNKVPRRLADIAKARELLGWQPEIDLEEGLTRLVAWWRAERQHEGTAELAQAS